MDHANTLVAQRLEAIGVTATELEPNGAAPATLQVNGWGLIVTELDVDFGETVDTWPNETIDATIAGPAAGPTRDLAIVFVSKTTGAALALPVSTRLEWTTIADTDAGKPPHLEAPRHLLQPFDALAFWLRARKAAPGTPPPQG